MAAPSQDNVGTEAVWVEPEVGQVVENAGHLEEAGRA